MSKTKSLYEASYLDEEERQIMEAFDVSIGKGEVSVASEAELRTLNTKWQKVLKESQQRKAITLRLQCRDISRLKSIARRRGIPYQTLVSSVLHQFANGDMVERTD